HFIGSDLNVNKIGIIDSSYHFVVSWNDKNFKSTSYVITVTENAAVLKSILVTNSNAELISLGESTVTTTSVPRILTVKICLNKDISICTNDYTLSLNPNDLTSQAKGEATVSPNRAVLASSSSLGNISLGEMAIFAVIGMFIILTVLVVIILIVCLVYRIKTRKNPRPLEGRRTAALN
ncbi:hypothetical protein, partial [Salmonella sp. s51228]|uniref:hypothetical protein n=1 Tax=Salmonella sp. s51228 TaxID=3159652 RepID=UPI003980F04B